MGGVEAEDTLFALARGTRLRVIADRPNYISPTDAERQLGPNLLYRLSAAVDPAVEATKIGEAMLQVTMRGKIFANRDKLSTRSIIGSARARAARHASDNELAQDHCSRPPSGRSVLRMVETAALRVPAILAQQPINQRELSLPFALRCLLAMRAEMVTQVLSIVINRSQFI